VVFIEGNLEEYISINQNFVIDFFHNLKAGIKLSCQILCLLRDGRFLSMLFIETTGLISYYALICQLVTQPHLN